MKKRSEIVVAILLLIIGVTWFVLEQFGAEEGTIAKVRIDNEIVREIDLARTEDQILHIEGGQLPVTLEIKDHQIAFINAVCPDKICQNNGFINRPPQQSVCLPAHVSVTVTEN